MFNSKMIGTNNAAAGGGGVAFVSTDVNFRSLDISDPSNITQLDSVSISAGTQDTNRGGISLDRDNNVAYVVNRSNVLTAIDISDSSNLSVLDTLTIGTLLSHTAIDLTTSVLYVANRTATSGEAGIYSINISNPSNLSVLQAYNGGFQWTGNLNYIDVDIINKKLILCNAYYYTYVVLNIGNPSSITNVVKVSKGQSPQISRYFNNGASIITVGERTVEKFSSGLGLQNNYTSEDYVYYPKDSAISENFNNFYIADVVSDKLTSYSLTNAALTSSLTGFTNVTGVDIDHTNNLIYTSARGGVIKVVQINSSSSMTELYTHTLTNAEYTKNIALY